MLATIHNTLEWFVSTMAHHVLFQPQLGGGTLTVDLAPLPKAFVLDAIGIWILWIATVIVSLFFLVVGYSMNGFQMV